MLPRESFVAEDTERGRQAGRERRGEGGRERERGGSESRQTDRTDNLDTHMRTHTGGALMNRHGDAQTGCLVSIDLCTPMVPSQ